MVPSFVGVNVVEAIVGTKVDNSDWKVLNGEADFHSVAMGQANEQEVAVFGNGYDVSGAFQNQIGDSQVGSAISCKAVRQDCFPTLRV